MEGKTIKICLILLLGFSFSSCQDDDEAPFVPPVSEVETLVHVSHPRMSTNQEFNAQLDSVDWQAFALRLLGGDLADSTSADDQVMNHFDQLFNLKDPNTLWTLGNHDYDSLSLVEQFTERPTFYAHTYKSLTFLVLDTQIDLSDMTGAQLDLIQNVTDTISQSSHLILLHHKVFWMYGNEELEEKISEVANWVLGDCDFCTNPCNFYEAVYPKLTAVQERGIEVLCIAGDLGKRSFTFFHQTAEGIQFLGAGMNEVDKNNPVILFDYEPTQKRLTWDFKLLSEL